jgi:hypothetical protein
MSSYVRWLERVFCSHPHDLRRAAGGRMWLECADCGRETQGIVVRPAAEETAAPPAASAALLFARRVTAR